MDIQGLINELAGLARANPAAAVASAIILLFVLWRWPKYFIIGILLALAVLGVMNIFEKLDATGLRQKEIPFVDKQF